VAPGIYHDLLKAWTPRQLVQLAVAQPPLFPPGTQWSYSNANYILLGLIIDPVDHAPAALGEAVPALEVRERDHGAGAHPTARARHDPHESVVGVDGRSDRVNRR
jgi:hypothetical protein